MADGSDGVSGPGLAAFNRLPAAEAERALLGCCSSTHWAGRVLAGLPYPSPGALLDGSDTATLALAETDLNDALAGHPRLGGRDLAGTSAREQAGVLTSGDAARLELAAGNDAYERRFGHIYLACATGRTAGELLELLRARLGNDPQTEWGVVRSELARINRIRLARLIGGES